MKTVYPQGTEQLYPLARDLLSELESEGSAHVLTLSGELGSGKTSFVQICGELLGLTHQITSPTFTLMHSFPLTHSRFATLYHLDLYRLSHHSEVQELGLKEILDTPSSFVLIEWPDRAEDLLADVPHYALYFSHVSPDRRRVDIYAPSLTS